MASPTACIQPNPDISGIGVRVSIYAQAFLSFISLAIFAMDSEITLERMLAIYGVVVTNELTASALLVSALVQARTYGLSLYHANIVLVLSWITFVPCAVAAFEPMIDRKRGLQLKADRKVKNVMWKAMLMVELVIWLHYIAVAGLGIWVWSDVKSFGSQPECTPWTFVLIFGYDIPVTNHRLRIAALFLYGEVAIGVAFIPLFILFIYCLRRRARRAPPRPELPSQANLRARTLWKAFRRHGKGAWFVIFLLGAGAEILLVASTEVLITRSKGLVQPGESQWTFGQSLAVFLVILPLVSTIGELKKGYEELREKKKRKRESQEQRELSDDHEL